MNEKFNKNAKVEKLTKKVGRGVRLIVIGPLKSLWISVYAICGLIKSLEVLRIAGLCTDFCQTC